MKKPILTLLFFIATFQVIAQYTVNIYGQIDNFNSEEFVFLAVGGELMPLNLSSSGSFSVDASITQFPSYFTLDKVSKRGKIEHQLPRIWFESDSVKVNIDWKDRTFQMEGIMPYQSISDEIEALRGKEQIAFILRNPNQIPSLYFTEREKEKIAIDDLDKFTQNVPEEYKKSIYVKRIDNYLEAKRRKPIKKGDQLKDFSLPDKSGDQIPVISRNDKPTLIALFSTGCSFSLASIGLLKQFSELDNNSVQLVTIWEDPTKEIWLNSYQDRKDKITWTNLWDEFGFASTYLSRKSWPTFYFFNEEGVLVDKFKSYNKKTAKRLKKLAG
ncbi:TlpA family protein disulfide reductase [Pararhodonellum marinum]|uniref:TlpA family protein disulfide reductase n=1 Tax=Pararhodonellum marinum TaxID=2755358 RepID=UPI00188E992F|nr:hypothetical protein [Pararhodonellum marinum]